MAYTDHIMKASLIGSMHGPVQCRYERWHGQKRDLLQFYMTQLESVVMVLDSSQLPELIGGAVVICVCLT